MSFLDQINFVTYDTTTGKIESWGETQRGAIVHMKLLGQSVIEGVGHPTTHRVDLETLTIVEREAETPSPSEEVSS